MATKADRMMTYLEVKLYDQVALPSDHMVSQDYTTN